MELNKSVFILFLFGVASLSAQNGTSGSKEYALASSSVMWLPRSGALFLNPAEIGRLHQDEFLVSADRFRNLSSMSGTLAFPGAGTFAAGIANAGDITNYTFGYGTLVGSHHTIGSSVSIATPIEDAFRFGFGGVLHFPSSIQNSGFHVGVSVSNLPKETIIDGGMAWWMIPDWFRIQAAAQNRIHRAMVYGAEFLASNNLSFLIGSRGFHSLYGGVSYRFPSFSADISAGPKGLSFSLNITVGESAEKLRSLRYEEGYNLYSEKRFAEAQKEFLAALAYDEYDGDSFAMAVNARTALDTFIVDHIERGAVFEQHLDFASAIDAYSAILRADPSYTAADSAIIAAQRKFQEHLTGLIAAGDSARLRKENTRARAQYELVLKYDPMNETASARIDELENLSKENVRNILAYAQSLVKKKQFDAAQKEYARVLTLEPKNAQAKAGLNTIASKRKEERLETAKTILYEGKYFEALKLLLELSEQNIKPDEVAEYIDIARRKLQSHVERQFKSGLAHYAKENYREAITIWNDALLIQPRHAGILEYRKRAEEKLKALDLLN